MADFEEPLSDEEKVWRLFNSLLNVNFSYLLRSTRVICSHELMAQFWKDNASFWPRTEVINLCFKLLLAN